MKNTFILLSFYPVNFKIECSSLTYPPTNVTWFKDNNEIIPSAPEYVTYQIMEDGKTTNYTSVLEVNGSNAPGVLHAGEYSCMLANGDGSSTMNILVQGLSVPHE